MLKKGRVPKDAQRFMKECSTYEHCTEFQCAVVSDKDTKEVVSVAVFKSGGGANIHVGDLELAFIRTRKEAERQGHAQCALAHGLSGQLCTSKRPLKILVADAAGTKESKAWHRSCLRSTSNYASLSRVGSTSANSNFLTRKRAA